MVIRGDYSSKDKKIIKSSLSLIQINWLTAWSFKYCEIVTLRFLLVDFKKGKYSA